MAKIKSILYAGLACIIVGVSCEKYDDSALAERVTKAEEGIESLDSRITALETAVKGINSNIDNMQAMIMALQNKLSVTGYTKNSDGSWTISFSDNNSITVVSTETLANTVKEAEDAMSEAIDGSIAKINVPLQLGIQYYDIDDDDDGWQNSGYYWAYFDVSSGNPEFVSWVTYTQNGKLYRISATSNVKFTVGANGTISISTDDGQSSTSLTSYDGSKYQMIKNISSKDGLVTVELYSGTSLVFPDANSFSLSFAKSGIQFIPAFGKSAEIALKAEGVKGFFVSQIPAGWKASTSGQKLVLTAPAADDPAAEPYGELTLVAVGYNGLTDIVSTVVGVGSSVIPDDEEFTMLSSSETANCYIVSAAGQYCFNATILGNGPAGIPAGAHTTTALAVPSSAELLWESTDGLVSDVAYDASYITFTASSAKGNAVIAAKDNLGKIVWSWHIWLTDAPAEIALPVAGVSILDRNLGSSAPNEQGLSYQWGRKDPFYGASTLDLASKFQVAYSGKYTVAQAVENPTTPVHNTTNWMATPNASLWSTEAKTIYDPCPAGYVVPSSAQIANKDKVSTSPVSTGLYLSVFEGLEGAYLPHSCAVNFSTKALYNRGGIGLMTTTTSSGKVTCLKYNSTSAAMTLSTSNNVNGYGWQVRCVKQQ
ncbi:MAG: PL29 family lyase N-terminal domain-containing protein [Bacteroidales bacterium]|nr:PL29 family lyase N-terminal domain-containing protein [Bacteroidales bacterium]